MQSKLQQGLDTLGLLQIEDLQRKMEIYIEAVLDFNKTYNLMKADTMDDMAVNHILDSLAAVSHINSLIQSLTQQNNIESLEIGDIGSGGGCPGIPLAAVYPQHSFTLVERMEKRCLFLESVINKIGLKNVTVQCVQADKVEKEKFHIEVFRAFHPFDKKIARLLLGMLKNGGFLVAYKARAEKIQEEMSSPEVQKIIPTYKKIALTVPFLEDHERNLVVIKK